MASKKTDASTCHPPQKMATLKITASKSQYTIPRVLDLAFVGNNTSQIIDTLLGGNFVGDFQSHHPNDLTGSCCMKRININPGRDRCLKTTTVTTSHFEKHISEEREPNPWLTFHYTGWLIGILIMA